MPWVMLEGGECVRGDHNHPEAYTVLAPQHFQDTCIAIGGLNRNKKAMFRVVLALSRKRVAGGEEVYLRDVHGNALSSTECEIFIPRYAVPKEYRDWYVLEKWLPPEWYAERGWGGDSDFIWVNGKQIRQLEPIWPEGNYEAVQHAVDTPIFINPKKITSDDIGRLIMLTNETSARTAREKASIARDNREAEHNAGVETSKEIIREAMGPFGIREFTSMRGEKSCKF